MSEIKEQSFEVWPFIQALGVFLCSLFGLSSLFVVGYTNGLPREAFLVFGSELALAVGVEAGFGIAFSLISAKALLIMASVVFALVGSVTSRSTNERMKKFGENADAIAIKIALAPLKVVLVIAVWVFLSSFFHFSLDSVMTLGGLFFVGLGVLNASDRVLFRQIKGASTDRAIAEIDNYASARLLLLATFASLFAYTAGLSAERQVKRQEPRTVSEQFDKQGIVFGAGKIGLLIFVPGELVETKAGGYFEKREPSRWYLLPFDGNPLELH